jgi:hypothetical protein
MFAISRLKLKARGHYIAYQQTLAGLDCGSSLGEVIRPQAAIHREAFNRTMDDLAKIDPNAPTQRL